MVKGQADETSWEIGLFLSLATELLTTLKAKLVPIGVLDDVILVKVQKEMIMNADSERRGRT